MFSHTYQFKKLRIDAGLSVPQLAKLARCGHETIYRYERGDTRTLHTKTVQKISRVLFHVHE